MKRVCIVGTSGSGKTSLIVKLVALLKRRGYKVGTLKHAHHDFDMDRRGKDSYRHFEAGAAVSGVISPNRTAVFSKTRARVRPKDLLPHYRGCDILILEGFRDYPCIEVFRKERKRIPNIRLSVKGPVFSPAQVAKIADFIVNEL